ncbi:MAG: FGGY family carbohydrate kinase [Bacteroidota bacterium]
MTPTPVIAIFDIGKTNKKYFLFNEQYKIVFERSVKFNETKDDDGFACDDVKELRKWVEKGIQEILNLAQFEVRALNFSAYGASFVHIDTKGEPVGPLYNYLKPYPKILLDKFYKTYGGELLVSVATASPVLGNLNSGMQLYWLKYTKGSLFGRIQYSMHLPQYISFLVTGKAQSEITSLGCHTGLWDFVKNDYHQWVKAEGITDKLPPISPSDEVTEVIVNRKMVKVGPGLHDSSSALIPYRAGFKEPFVLISTGTWCISFNPFNKEPLTEEELQEGCVYYIGYDGEPVKASRLFSGNQHEQALEKLASHFNMTFDAYRDVTFNPALINHHSISSFSSRELNSFRSYNEAYHHLMYEIIEQQKKATTLILSNQKVSRIFVDGGFSKNTIYMQLLAAAFADMEVYAASISQASAIGAAMAIHAHWNKEPLWGNTMELTYYKPEMANL